MLLFQEINLFSGRVKLYLNFHNVDYVENNQCAEIKFTIRRIYYSGQIRYVNQYNYTNIYIRRILQKL